MKNVTILVLSLIALGLFGFRSVNAPSDQVIAYVDYYDIIYDMPSYAAAEEALAAYTDELEDNIQSKQEEADNYYTDVISKVQAGLLSPSQQQAAEEKMDNMNDEIYLMAESADYQIANRESALLNGVFKEFKAATLQVAEANGYTYVLDSDAVVATNGGIDATQQVRDALGL